jgi:hypothetical protein
MLIATTVSLGGVSDVSATDPPLPFHAPESGKLCRWQTRRLRSVLEANLYDAEGSSIGEPDFLCVQGPYRVQHWPS